MVYRKKTNFRKKRMVRKYKPKFIRKRFVPKNVFAFKRFFEATDLATTAVLGAQVPQNLSVSFSNLPSPTDFTNLFDMYKICAIKVTYIPDLSEAIAGQQSCNLNSWLDYNDIGIPVITTGEQKESYKTTKGTRIHKRYFKPQVPITVSDVSATSFLQCQRAPWISTTNTNIAHIGLKVISDPTPSAAIYTWQCRVVVYFKCKYVS